MLSDCTKQIKDKESWLPGVVPPEGDVERELTSLLATAALVRGAFQAIPVPEGAEEASRARYTALIEEQWQQRRHSHTQQRPWPAVLGSWLRVVFTLGKRR